MHKIKKLVTSRITIFNTKGEPPLKFGSALRVLVVIGLLLILFQFFFGLFSLVLTQSYGTPHFLITDTDKLTSHGALHSLRTFGSESMLAGFAALLPAAGAFMICKGNKRLLLSGLLLILAGTANSVILYSAGLPAGIALMAAGTLMLIRRARLHELESKK